MSDLTRIQDEILRRFRPRRTTLDDIPGFAGGTLGEQTRPRQVVPGTQSDQRDITWDERPRRVGSDPIQVFAPPQQPTAPQLQNPQPASAGQVLTPRNQAAITRPRSVFSPPPETRPRYVDPVEQVQNESIQSFGSSGEPFTPSRERRTQPRDEIADSAQYLKDLEARPRNRKDTTVDVLRAFNQGFGSNPNAFTPTKREREILEAQGMLKRDVELQKAQTAQEMSQMVPIYDAAGNIIGSAPRKTAAGTQIRATDTGTRAVETKRRNDAYIADVERRPKKEQAEAARKIYASGVADGNDELKAALAKRMGIAQELPDADKGTVQVGADGNFTIVHGRTATSNVVKDEAGTPAGAWSPVQFKAAEDGRNKRARERNIQSEKNATIMAGGVVSRMGDPVVHQKNLTEIDQDIDGVETETDGILARQQKEGFLPSDPATLNQLRQRKNALERERRDEREKLGKLESAQSNLQQRGAGTRSGRTWSQGKWKAANPNGDVNAAIQAAKAKGYRVVE